MTFEEAYEKLSDITTSVASYERESCKLLWESARQLGAGDRILEVGCEYGRSTALLAMAAQASNGTLTVIDPFLDAESSGVFLRNMRAIGVPFTLHMMTTSEAVGRKLIHAELAFVHIDGGHNRSDIGFDCSVLLPRIAIGGFAVFHDYERDSLPAVKSVVDMWTEGRSDWERVGLAATCLVMRKK